jgi:hypothetical protein
MSGDEVRVACPLFQEECSGATPTSPLQLQIEKMPSHIAALLNRQWHSRFPRINNAGQCEAYGAIFENRYYAVALWSDPIARMFNGRKMWELRRFAIAPDAPRFTASRMLSIMTKLIRREYPALTTLISYQDTAVHTGVIYKSAGWKAKGFKRALTWNNATRSRPIDECLSDKIRWEYALRRSL